MGIFEQRATPAVVDLRLLECARAPRLDLATIADLTCLCPQLSWAWCDLRGIEPGRAVLRDELARMPAWQIRITLLRCLSAAASLSDAGDASNWLAELEANHALAALARYAGLADSEGIRARALIAAAAQRHDAVEDVLLSDMIEFSGAPPELLAEAHVAVLLVALLASERSGATDAAERLSRLAGVPMRRVRAALEEAGDAVRTVLERLRVMPGESNRAAVIEQLEKVRSLSALSLEWGHSMRLGELREHARGALGRRFGGAVAELVAHESGGDIELLGDAPLLADIRVRLGESRALASEAVRQERVLLTADEPEPLMVVDRQVLRRLDADAAAYVPLVEGERALGTLVLACPDDRPLDRIELEWIGVIYAQWVHQRTMEAERLHKIEADYLAANEKRLREVVHEANNPLSIVHNYLHLLGLRLKDEDAGKEQLRMIGEEIRRTGEILQGLLRVPMEVSEDIEARAEGHHGDHSDLGAAVRGVAGLLGDVLSARRIALNLDIEPGVPEVAAPEDAIRQVVSNLLRNACEALEDGGRIDVRVRGPLVRDGEPCAELVIADDGPGLAPEVLAKIGEPKQTDKGPEHAGLGLHVVHRQVSALGGSIETRTREGEGTSFTILIPLA